MIFDKVENYQIYNFGDTWQDAFEFVQTIDAGSEEKVYNLKNRVVAYLVSYETKSHAESELEAHRKCVDLHVTISGQEKMECFDRNELLVHEIYDESQDVEYYEYPGSPPAELYASEGYFTAFWPGDAHVPSLMVGNKSQVKKIVFKIPVDCLIAR